MGRRGGKLTAVSLFSGAGGLDLGFEQSGVRVVVANDSWDVALETYKTNRRDGKTEVLVGSLEKYADEIACLAQNANTDMVFGGPPCQDFSSAGWRTGDGLRADLTSSFVKLALKIRPEWVVMENVNTIMSIGRRHAEYAIKALGRARYTVTTRVLDAADFGAPQYRKRFFLIARKGAHNMLELAESIEKERKRKPLTVRRYYPAISRGDYGTEFYYRHPWSFERRAIFSIDEPSPTIRGVNRPIPPSYKIHHNDATDDLGLVRPLTTEERSILQTFPKKYTFVGNKTEREQQVGNSVPPTLAKAVARAIVRL